MEEESVNGEAEQLKDGRICIDGYRSGNCVEGRNQPKINESGQHPM